MPVYIHSCTKHGPFERLVPMSEASSYSACPACGERAPRDYAAEHPTSVVGMVDGETVGYFPPAAGPYVDPGRSIKRVVKNKHAWREMIKRSEGKIGDIS